LNEKLELFYKKCNYPAYCKLLDCLSSIVAIVLETLKVRIAISEN